MKDVTLEEIRERFKNDRYATEAAGVVIRVAEPGHAICDLPVAPHLLNANDVPMGGALFTLADFTFAVASNAYSEDVTVARQISMTFLAAAKGSVLTAEATCIKAGRTTCLYEVKVTDDEGVYVAHMVGNGYSVGKFVKPVKK